MDKPVIPDLLSDLATFINRWPAKPDVWKRFRIAVTVDEMAILKQFFKEDEAKAFYWAIRGVPLQIEEEPTNLIYRIEPFDA